MSLKNYMGHGLSDVAGKSIMSIPENYGSPHASFTELLPYLVLTIRDGTQECLWRCLGLSISCCSRSQSLTFSFDGFVGFDTYGVRLPTILKVVEPKTSRDRIRVCY